MNCVTFKLIDFNYPFQGNVAISATSQDNNFPSSNLGHKFKAKSWRSSGYYEITSANNKIDFREVSLGPEITATVTVGNYSKDELATAIKSSLDAVGGETYTVTYSESTGKWTISSGGGYLDVLFATGSNSGFSIADSIGFSSSDLSGSVSYSGGFTAIHTVERAVFDLKTTEEIDTFAIVFDPGRGIRFSNEAVIKLKANHSNVWNSPAVDITLSIDADFNIITNYFDTDQSYRFWCIEIIDPKNPDLYVELGTVFLGKSVVFDKIPDTGYNFRLDDKSKGQSNDFGNRYFDEYPILRTLDLNFGSILYAQHLVMEKIFRRIGQREPVFVAMDTGEKITDKNQYAFMGGLQSQINYKHKVRGIFEVKWTITEQH